MPTDELASIPAAAPINGFALLPGRDLLLVESQLSLFAARESALRAPGRRPEQLDFAQLPCVARTPDCWSVSRASGRIWLLDDARLRVAPLELPFGDVEDVDLGPVEAVLAEGDGIVAISANADGSRLVLQVTTGDDPAYELFVARSFEPASGRTFELAELEGLDRLAVDWSEAAGSFVISNLEAERVVRWDGAGPNGDVLLDLELEEAGPPLLPDTATLCEIALRPRGESLMLCLRDERPERFCVASLPLAPAAPPAQCTPPLPAGDYFAWAWRRDDPLGACVRDTDEGTSVCLVSAQGGVAAECELPESWKVNCLAWSEDESLLYIGTDHCLGTWRAPAG